MAYKSQTLKGVSCPSKKQSKRLLFSKLKMWIWRQRRDQFSLFWSSKSKKSTQNRHMTGIKISSRRVQKRHLQNPEITIARDSLSDQAISHQELCRPAVLPAQPSSSPDPRQIVPIDRHIVRGDADQNPPLKKEPSQGSGGEPCDNVCLARISNLCLTPKHLPRQGTDTNVHLAVSSKGIQGNMKPSQPVQGGQKMCRRLGQSQCVYVSEVKGQKSDEGGKIASRNISSKKVKSSDVIYKALTKDIKEFLNGYYRIYGSFFPLQMSDVLTHLKRRCNNHLNREDIVLSEVARYKAAVEQTQLSHFRVVFKKHRLTLEDLSTLADQNWLNDQVINMYGEMIMEAAQHKVYFLNSFFHRQLDTKGYSGVKRWTKKVNLFSMHLLLVPIHMEDHWCLVTADMVRKTVNLYDSQGIAFQEVAKDILEYLRAEANESKQTAFQNGWVVTVKKRIPQQRNENDCGVFVLEFCRCLALGKPLLFSQKDIPTIRKRIYKELCGCRLHT